MIKNHQFNIKSNGFTDVINITDQVTSRVAETGIKNGNVLVFSPGATCGITTIEYETGAVTDFKEFLNRIAPEDIDYKHNERWGDGNGFSHVRAALMKSFFMFPVIDGEAVLGTWQQIVFIDFDNQGRQRTIYVQVQGD